MKYGIIENGALRAFDVLPEKKIIQREDGTYYELEISVEMKIVEAARQGLKPVEAIDMEQMNAPVGRMVIPHPVDYGDYIGFEYENVLDVQYFENQIKAKKALLASTDYQVIKCYEATMAGEEPPYNLQLLRSGRQALRDEINELENIINK